MLLRAVLLSTEVVMLLHVVHEPGIHFVFCDDSIAILITITQALRNGPLLDRSCLVTQHARDKFCLLGQDLLNEVI